MSSTVTRIRLTGVTIRFINTATMGNTTKSRIRLPIHHKIMSDLSFAQESSSRGFLAEEPAEEPLHRRHPCLHGNTEALHWNGLTLCRSLSPRGSSDVFGDTLGEATHDDARDVLNHASAELSSCAGELKILSDLDLRPASRRHHRRRDFHRRLALALLLGPGRVHHDSLVSLVALNNLCRTGKLHRYRPHLGCHAPLVHVPVDISEFGTRHAGRYPRHVLHVLPHLHERRRNLELVLDNHRLLALLTTLGRNLGSRHCPRPSEGGGILHECFTTSSTAEVVRGPVVICLVTRGTDLYCHTADGIGRFLNLRHLCWRTLGQLTSRSQLHQLRQHPHRNLAMRDFTQIKARWHLHPVQRIPGQPSALHIVEHRLRPRARTHQTDVGRARSERELHGFLVVMALGGYHDERALIDPSQFEVQLADDALRRGV